jgi:hypothetical protein
MYGARNVLGNSRAAIALCHKYRETGDGARPDHTRPDDHRWLVARRFTAVPTVARWRVQSRRAYLNGHRSAHFKMKG